jgi:uncharacterized membrane protein HdeD (DUF308 family)
MTLILGVLFVILKGEVVEIAITVFGIVLIVTAVLELIRLKIASGIIKAILGIAVLTVGWMLIDIALLVIGIVLMVFGVLELVKRLIALFKKNNTKLFAKILGFISPVFSIVAGYFLITSSGEAVGWAIIVGGVLLIINGVLALVEALASKN